MLTDRPGKTGSVSACVYLLSMAWHIFLLCDCAFRQKNVKYFGNLSLGNGFDIYRESW